MKVDLSGLDGAMLRGEGGAFSARIFAAPWWRLDRLAWRFWNVRVRGRRTVEVRVSYVDGGKLSYRTLLAVEA
jgi:hypothetical protein